MEYLTSLFSVALLASAIRVTMPILLASLGAVHAERGGVVNIGLEGIMIMGTFFGAVGAYAFDAQFPFLAKTWPDLAPLAGVLAAIAAGLLFGLIHALVTITFRVDQIISGVALNLLAGGLARFLNILLFEKATQSPGVRGFTPIDIPLLRDLPALRPLRSEEHTSELQSQSNLVCRLLLEKKKNKRSIMLYNDTKPMTTFQTYSLSARDQVHHIMSTNHQPLQLYRPRHTQHFLSYPATATA